MSEGGAVSVCLDLSPSHGGMYRGVVDIAEMLRSPIVAFRDGSGVLPPDCSGLDVTHVDCTGVSRVAQVFRLPRRLRHAAVDALEGAAVIVAHSLFRAHAMLVHEYARRSGVPYLIVPHGALEPELWRTQRWRRLAWLLAGGRRYLQDASAIVFATERERKNAVRTLGFVPRSAVIPFPVDVGEGSPSDDTRSRARAKLGIPMESRVLLVLGRLDPVKRPHAILQAFVEADARNCVLVFAGGDGLVRADDLRASLPTAARSRVFFLGHLDTTAKAEALAASDGYLSWSAHESFGYAAAESMAAGLPVILASTHPLADGLHDRGCGILAASATRHDLVVAIREFASWSPAVLHGHGAAAREWVSGHLARADVTKRWHDLLGTVASP
jgi:glycosyltransferase involved in cell wall biosynthesis